MFIKFPEIENSYNIKEIERFIELYPELKDEKYIVWEKLDGANIQITLSKNCDIQICSRKRVLNRDEAFFGIWNILASQEYKQFISDFRNRFIDFNLYGEIFGKDIQKRINYGDEQYLLFYMFRLDGHIIPPKDFISIMLDMGYGRYICPYELVDGFSSVMSCDIERNTVLNSVEGKNIIEGIVFLPYDKIYRSKVNSLFIFKKKSEGYQEVCKKKILKIKNDEDFDPRVSELNEVFKGYINRNRILSAISKEGPIRNVREIGKYHKIVMDDAKKDFLKDYHEVYDVIPFKQKKAVFSIKSMLADMLRNEIYEEQA